MRVTHPERDDRSNGLTTSSWTSASNDGSNSAAARYETSAFDPLRTFAGGFITGGMKRDLVLAGLLLGSLVGNIYLYTQLSQVRSQEPFMRSLDQPFIERSIADYSARSGQPPEDAMVGRFPVVARTADGLCVNLMLDAGWLGWVPVYCYTRDGRLTYRGQV